MNMNDHLNNQWLDRLDADIAAKPAPPTYKLVTVDQLRDLPPLRWIVKGVLPERGLAAIAGPSGSGKSFLALDLAAAIAGGHERWFGYRVKAKPVIYAILEGEGGFKLRAQAWEMTRGYVLPQDLRMVMQPFKLTQDALALAAVVPQGAVVVLDTLNRAAPTADENSSRDMGEILEAAKQLESLTGGLVLLVHHTGKDESKGLRGHSSLFAALDAVITVSREGEQRQWKLAKSKDGLSGVGKVFALESVHLSYDEDDDAVTSCVVVPSDEPMRDAARAKRMGACEGAVLEYLSAQPAGVRKKVVVEHLEGRYEKGPIYRAMKSLVEGQLIHESVGMVAIAGPKPDEGAGYV